MSGFTINSPCSSTCSTRRAARMLAQGRASCCKTSRPTKFKTAVKRSRVLIVKSVFNYVSCRYCEKKFCYHLSVMLTRPGVTRPRPRPRPQVIRPLEAKAKAWSHKAKAKAKAWSHKAKAKAKAWSHKAKAKAKATSRRAKAKARAIVTFKARSRPQFWIISITS